MKHGISIVSQMLPALIVLGLVALFLAPAEAFCAAAPASAGAPWWIWVLGLFVFSFILGIVAVLGGVGGGVLFVPIVSSFFPFHLDYVRGAGLLVALAGSLAAGPPLLRKGLADLELGLPMALIGSVSSIAGAIVGLMLPAQQIQLMLGIVVLGVTVIMITSGKSGYPEVRKQDGLSRVLQLSGLYYEEFSKQEVSWQAHRTPVAMLLFFVIGFIGGMFGLGAGFANVPVYNLLMGVPLKVSVATSGLVLSINGSAAAWVYIFNGAVLPLITVPSIAGMMIGSKIGAKLLPKVNTKTIRVTVIAILALSGIRSLLKGFGI
ncbi:MAG TPA: sulfite exporter TauE/SafE family protein [Chlorobaculum parvum]|uniref:Probable membrane transporter protein n=1 Tax=Chlorobaculum parvum TaxID=274539 RepID=A0A7C5DDB9_9CHLB|nr:sulfite exporter TauE/SafE family protein [Chlorobaculum parvum]